MNLVALMLYNSAPVPALVFKNDSVSELFDLELDLADAHGQLCVVVVVCPPIGRVAEVNVVKHVARIRALCDESVLQCLLAKG